MKNTEIIYAAAQEHGYTAAQLDGLMAVNGGDLPLHTFAEWMARGYHVKKGEKSRFSCELWKHTNKPSKAAIKRAEEEGKDAPEESPHFYLATAYIFAAEQVEANAPKA